MGLSTQSLPSKEGPGTVIFLSGACSLHPALGSVLPGVWSRHLLCACSGWRQLDTGPGPPVSFHRKGFQAQPRPRDKRTSVHPLVPSPSFLKQHSFMWVPPPLQPPPAIHCLLSDGLYGGLVCLRCSTQAFCCSLLFSPRAPSEHTLSREDRRSAGGRDRDPG